VAADQLFACGAQLVCHVFAPNLELIAPPMGAKAHTDALSPDRDAGIERARKKS
jgi:hypothetical protein